MHAVLRRRWLQRSPEWYKHVFQSIQFLAFRLVMLQPCAVSVQELLPHIFKAFI